MTATDRVLTAEEAAALRDAATADELETAARALRARWVAEALEDLAARYPADIFPDDGTSRDAISGSALRTVLTAQAKLHRDGAQ